jgi:two-component system response regulator (stage 0 sporulation protein A)
VINLAISHGAAYYFIKPITPNNIAERLLELLNESKIEYKVNSEVREKRRITSLDEKISNIFITIGIPPHIKGYVYLREGIKMSVEDPSIINRVTKELYPKIGEKYSTSASKVERAIRHAIEVAWNRGRTDEISSIFGARVYIGKERPTNSEFIALVADKLILEFLV